MVWWASTHTTPADEETRKLRREAHLALDPIWKQRISGMRRIQVYDILVKKWNINHIGIASAQQCREIIEWAEQFKLLAKAVKETTNEVSTLPQEHPGTREDDVPD